MGTNVPNKVIMPTADEVEDNDTTVEIKIRTLDSQTHTLRVNKRVPVHALKEQIASVTGMLSEQQRLICRGKVLRDDQLLSAYHVEDGHTLHLVSRQPISSSSTAPSASTIGSEGGPVNQGLNLASTNAYNHANHVAHSNVIDAVNINQGDHSTSNLSREAGSERFERAAGVSGPSYLSNPQPSPAVPRVDLDSRQAAFQFPSAFNLGFQQPSVRHDSLTTMRQYIDHLREAFRGPGGGPNNYVGNSVVNADDGQLYGFPYAPAPGQGGLPTPASLAEILLSVRGLLTEQAGGHLSQLSRQLESQESVTDPWARINIQSNASRSGLLLQNLGSLLLELGRTTMTLHMGQTPAEAMVNSGPAVYISGYGPNPVMVQPAPFISGSSFGLYMGAANSVPGLQVQSLSSSYLPRNVDMRAHSDRGMYVAAVNLGGQSGVQLSQEQIEPVPVANFMYEALSGATDSPSISEESGMQVVPIRTLSPLHVGLGRFPPDLSGRATRLFIPVFARIRRQRSGYTNEARGSQSSIEPQTGVPEADRQITLQSSHSRRDGNHLPGNITPVSGMDTLTNDTIQYQGTTRMVMASHSPSTHSDNASNPLHDEQQTGQGQSFMTLESFLEEVRAQQETNASGHQDLATVSTTNQTSTDRTSEEQETPVDEDNQGIFFSNLVRQLMPYIVQATATVPDVSPENPNLTIDQTERGDSTDPNSSGHHNDQPEAPNPKRQKKD